MEPSTAIKLNIQKDFSVPQDQLFDAWTKEEELKQWWNPLGNHLEKVINDLRVGGQVRYEFNNSDGGKPIIIEGVYKEVHGKEKLVYTWNWNLAEASISSAEFLLEVEFQAQENGSRLKVTQENFSNEEAVQPHREGWEKALHDLKAFLEQE